MPTASHSHSANVVGGKIYIIDGRIRHTSSPEGVGFATVARVLAYHNNPKMIRHSTAGLE
jgi:hypothetical protein